ncbi:unnamed protein product, partial [Effrenium voratum]
MEGEVLEALRRLYSGDASASCALEAFQNSPGALEVSAKLLQSTSPEVQFFGASTIQRIVSLTRDHQVSDIDWLLSEAARLPGPARRQLCAAAALCGASAGHAAQRLAGDWE